MTTGAEKSKKMTVPERLRRESSPTAFKATVQIGGISYPHKGKRSNEAEVLKMKDRMGSGAQYPWSVPGSMEDCREQWCDGKRLPQVHICQLSLVRVLGYCWDRPTVL